MNKYERECNKAFIEFNRAFDNALENCSQKYIDSVVFDLNEIIRGV